VTQNHIRASVERIAIIFVHLGRNPSPTLNHYARIAFDLIPNASLVLITDIPSLHPNFPGRVVEFDRAKLPRGFQNYIRKTKAYNNVAGGYWRYTIERLFALLQLPEEITHDSAVIHFESDVMSFLNSETIAFMKIRNKKTAVVRYSTTDAIASLLFSPSVPQLYADLAALDDLLAKSIKIQSDMELLGLALTKGILGELPSKPVEDWLLPIRFPGEHQRYLVFDGLAFGQYLFGQDPLHTNNRSISGFQNSKFDVQLNSMQWKLLKDLEIVGTPVVSCSSQTYELVIGAIHIHSKRRIEPYDWAQWQIVMDEANGLLQRSFGEYSEDVIHSRKVSTRDRIRMARKRGIKKLSRNLAAKFSRKFKRKNSS
jgi:hypothetical protein